MSAESWPEGIREAVEDFRRDVPKIMNGEFVCVPDPGEPKALTKRQLVGRLNSLVASHMDFPPVEIFGQGKRREVIRARFICWRILNELHGWTVVEIARMYRRDHSSVVNGLARYPEMMAQFPGLAVTARTIRAEWICRHA